MKLTSLGTLYQVGWMESQGMKAVLAAIVSSHILSEGDGLDDLQAIGIDSPIFRIFLLPTERADPRQVVNEGSWFRGLTPRDCYGFNIGSTIAKAKRSHPLPLSPKLFLGEFSVCCEDKLGMEEFVTSPGRRRTALECGLCGREPGGRSLPDRAKALVMLPSFGTYISEAVLTGSPLTSVVFGAEVREWMGDWAKRGRQVATRSSESLTLGELSALMES